MALVPFAAAGELAQSVAVSEQLSVLAEQAGYAVGQYIGGKLKRTAENLVDRSVQRAKRQIYDALTRRSSAPGSMESLPRYESYETNMVSAPPRSTGQPPSVVSRRPMAMREYSAISSRGYSVSRDTNSRRRFRRRFRR